MSQVKTVTPDDEQVSEIIESLDAIVVLDYLKQWNTALLNDFSAYKRAIGQVGSSLTEADVKLVNFLILPNAIIKNLREETNKIPQVHKTISGIGKLIFEKFHKEKKPEQLRTMALLIYLVDPNLKNPQILNEIATSIKLGEALSDITGNDLRMKLLGDQNLSFNVTSFLKLCPNFMNALDGIQVEEIVPTNLIGITPRIGGFFEKAIMEGCAIAHDLFNYQPRLPNLVKITDDAPNKTELYAQQFEQLQPTINLVRKLSDWVSNLEKALGGYIPTALDLVESSHDVSEDFINEFIELLDLVVMIDYLKTWQVGLNNDFSMYKRATQQMGDTFSINDESLRSLLINQHFILRAFENEVTKVKGSFKFLAFIIQKATEKYQKNNHNQFIRSISFCVFLLDNTFVDPVIVDYLKKIIDMKVTVGILHKHQKITLMGDLPFHIGSFLKSCHNFVENLEILLEMSNFEVVKDDPVVLTLEDARKEMERLKKEAKRAKLEYKRAKIDYELLQLKYEQ